MKEVWSFLQWQCRRLELWQWAFIFASFLQGVGWTLGGEYGPWIAVFGAGIILAFLLKWAVWDGTLSAWNRYKKERNELLTTIRDSDK